MCGGGSETNIYQPTPPPAPSTADAVQAYTENLPAMYEAQMEYAPKFSEQQMQLAQQYVPQITELQQQLQQQYAPQQAAQQWELDQQYAPLYAAQQQELQQLYEPQAYQSLQNMSQLLTPDYLTNYQAPTGQGFGAAKDRLRMDARSAWADRGLAQSGMSAEDETRMLSEFEFPYAMQQEQLGLQELGRRQNLAMSMAGRFGVPNIQGVQQPQVGIPQYQAPNLMSGFDFGTIQQGQQQGYSSFAQAARPMALQNQQNPGGISLGFLGQFGGR